MSRKRVHNEYEIVNVSPELTTEERVAREREISQKVYSVFERHLERTQKEDA